MLRPRKKAVRLHFMKPKRFSGLLQIGETSLPLSAKVSVDNTGKLDLDVVPFRLTPRTQPGYFAAVRHVGAVGGKSQFWTLQLSSTDGWELTSEHVYDGGHRHADKVFLYIRVRCAKLLVPYPHPPQNQTLEIRLRGFGCMPKLFAECGLGRVTAGGDVHEKDLSAPSGALIVQSDDTEDQGWRGRADDFLQYMKMGLTFARAGRLSAPMMIYTAKSTREYMFWDVSPAGASELAVQNELDLDCFFQALVKSYDFIGKDRDALAVAIGWVRLETPVDEVRFLGGMTALESLTDVYFPRKTREIVSSKRAKEIHKKLNDVLKAAGLTDEQRLAMKENIAGLNRPSFKQNIAALLAHWDVSLEDISSEMIDTLVSLRNDIVHRGVSKTHNDLWEPIIVIREIIARIVMKMLKYEGRYQSYLGQSLHWRDFPSCRRSRT